ncbi:DUF1330 domain-containing protein (plasmid) [Sinorhizobium meliloti]|nr:DUF1330 domain-containing protein [Sinorhizobium meliloti]WKL24527.1 DUF1330 domain-containing protein [Sinorhizobium meliloti]
MKGYWLIIGTEMADEEAQRDYGELWKPIATKYGARVNQLATPPILLEARDGRRVIVVEFPSYEIARACYDDPEYQEARLMALKASKRALLIIKGDRMTPARRQSSEAN